MISDKFRKQKGVTNAEKPLGGFFKIIYAGYKRM